jgi:hypothetical protein
MLRAWLRLLVHTRCVRLLRPNVSPPLHPNISPPSATVASLIFAVLRLVLMDAGDGAAACINDANDSSMPEALSEAAESTRRMRETCRTTCRVDMANAVAHSCCHCDDNNIVLLLLLVLLLVDSVGAVHFARRR